VRFGGEDNNELLTVPLPAGQAGDLPGDAHSFVQVTPDNAVLAGFKVAEEDGLIARLWECAGRDTTASVRLAGLGRVQEARQTDLLERDRESLTVAQGGVAVQLQARGLAAARFVL
jgi:alpha-mannosidase